MVEPRGGGGSGALVLAVALLAGFLFIGGAAAIYLSQPQATAGPTDIAFASGSPTLPPFVQPTATPSPMPSPTFILLPSDSPTFGSFSPLPTDTFGFPTPQPTPHPTPQPTNGQPTPTPNPTARPVVLKFACGQIGTKKQIGCSDNSTGPVASREWNFGDNTPLVSDRQPIHTYSEYGTYTVTLLVNGADGKQYFKQKEFTLQPPPSPTPTPSPTPAVTPTPAATPTPSDTPPPTPSSSTTAPVASVIVESATPTPDVTPTP
ncbi:MAG: PKD domain-containing protein [Chloroflexota bacterium]